MKKNLVVKIFGMMLVIALVISLFPSGRISADPQESENNNEEVYYGDVDDDGKIGAKDITTLRRYLAGGWDVTINDVKSDVNADGNVDAKDVTVLRRYLAGGWGVTLPDDPNKEPEPIAFRQASLDSINIIFDSPISEYSKDYVTAYYMNGEEKKYFNVLGVNVDYEDIIELNVKFDSYIPQGETIYAEYKGIALGSIKSVEVTADSVCAIEVQPLTVIADQETKLQYKLLDQYGVDITGMMGTVLNGSIKAELAEASIDSYIAGLTDFRIYIRSPYETFYVIVSYSWIDADGIQKCVEVRKQAVSVPDEPWQLQGFMGVITHEYDEDLVSSDHRSLNYYDDKISPLTMDTKNVVLQIAVSYYRQGETWFDTGNYSRNLYLTAYPDRKRYERYDFESSDRSVVRIIMSSGNKAWLELNNAGNTNILVYGALTDGNREVIGVVPVKVMPSPNSLLNDLGAEYVHNNTIDSEIRITASDAESFVLSDGAKNTALKDAECCIDSPDANVVQIAVPYTNIDSTVYAGLEKAPLSSEFTEYVVESSNTDIVELGEIVSGKLKLTCKDIGLSTISLYGKGADGTLTLLATKSIRVSRSKVNSPEVVSVRQADLETIEVIFDRDVTGAKLWSEDFSLYYTVQDVKISFSFVHDIAVEGDKALVRFMSRFTQETEHFVEFDGKLAGSFTAATVSDGSVAKVVVDTVNVEPDKLKSIDYRLFDSNNVDITEGIYSTLTGTVRFRIKEQERYPFAMIMYDSCIYLADEDSACTIVGIYSWIDADGNMHEAKGEAVCATGDGKLLPAVASYGQGGYPEESTPVRLEVYTYRGSSVLQDDYIEKKINSAYADDSLNILVNVMDQYGNSIEDITVNVQMIYSRYTGYSGPDTLISGQPYNLKASEVSGNGVLKLELTCGDGSGELTKRLLLEVGK